MQWMIHSAAAGALVLFAAATAFAEPRAEYDPGTYPADLVGKQTWVEIDGTVYGAKPDETGPIGGGAGYKNAVTSGDFTAKTPEELFAALKQAKPGQVVFIPGDVEFDMTSWILAEQVKIELPEGVTLASDRGVNGSEGALIYSDEYKTSPLIQVTGPGTRITGIRLRGPDPKLRMDLHQRAYRDGGGADLYYKFPKSDGVLCSSDSLEVDNCELSGWSRGALSIMAGKDHRVHHNHIHHNQHHGLGYGVMIDQAFVTIDYNLFDYCRHHIAGTGRPSGYEAANNVSLGHANSHLFDMHGGRDRKDGTKMAGTWMKVHHNSFWNADQRAVVIRGVPQEKAEIHHNWFYTDAADTTTLVSDGNTYAEDNVYGKEPKKLEENYPFEKQADSN